MRSCLTGFTTVLTLALATPAGQVLEGGVDRGVVEETGHGPILASQASRRSILATVAAAPIVR